MMSGLEKREEDMDIEIYFSAEPKEAEIEEACEKAVAAAVRETLLYEDFPADAEVSVTFCDPAHIRSLNAAYRNKDAETDVLSFPLFEREEDLIPFECVPLGDIVINLSRAATQAQELGHSTLRETAFLAVHSTLHLLGYDHELSPEDEEDMCRRQREIMQRLTEKLEKEGMRL